MSLLFLVSCGDDSDSSVIVPDAYIFLRDGNSTVSFSGQTTRILMAEELIAALSDPSSSKEDLLNMFRNKDEEGNEVDPYQSVDLNASTKSISSKVATSRDFFFSNTVESATISNQFEVWIEKQATEVFPYEETLATPGISGQIADESTFRYVSTKGLEYNQVFGKSLIGALMVDQILNNYLSPSVLDEADNRLNNEGEILAEGESYTTMEHNWDEAYGYLFGNSMSIENPMSDLGSGDNFLNKYVGRVNDDNDFEGIGLEIYSAFKLGRAAIVAKDYDVRDQQADIIKDRLSKVISIRAVHYLQQGKNALPLDGNLSKYGTVFHNLSEGIGFVYSLRFTRRSGSSESYFTRAEVDGFLDLMLNNSANGLWDIDGEILDSISKSIADKFDFTIAQAAD